MRVGIIGASFAKAAYLPALRHVAGAEVVAIASARLASAQAAAAAFGVPFATDDWRGMLDSQALDLVCIATPTATHAPMTLAALARGAHVLCEKPTAMDATEARAMLDAAEAAGRLHMIDHELRFNPARRHVRDLIAAGAIGGVRDVLITSIGSGWADPASRPAGDWWSLAEQGGGRLGANGSHQVDLLRWWLGEVASVSGQLHTAVSARQDKSDGAGWLATADDVARVELTLRSGTRASIFISAVARHAVESGIQIFGSEGTILLSGSDDTLRVGRAGTEFETIRLPDRNAELDGINKGIWNVSVVALLREFAAAIAEGRPLREGATFHDGWRNQLVLDAARQSSRERRWVDLT